ncbi:MAG TPA: cytochrome c oxidase subunit II [Thermoleophilaceae bacterium]
MPRRLLLAAFSLAAVAILIAAPSAFADAITPESGGSQNADDIDTLYKLTLYIGLAIFLLVEGTLIWSLVKYRARRGGTADQIRGNTPLEIGWTVGAATILVVLTVVTFLYLDDIESPPPSGPNGLSANQAQFASVDQPDPPKSGGPILRIRVNGQQYLWRYDYPGNPGELYSYEEMVVPTNTTVVLELEASDVIHSWWIPKFGPKADAVPGYVNETWFKVPNEGTYRGQCAELCGSGHADMRAQVVAVSPDEYEQWARDKREEIKEAGEELAAQREQRLGGEGN